MLVTDEKLLPSRKTVRPLVFKIHPKFILSRWICEDQGKQENYQSWGRETVFVKRCLIYEIHYLIKFGKNNNNIE